MKALTLKQVIEKSSKVHGDKFICLDYVNVRTKMNVKCKICDSVFPQLPNNHLAGHGCPICKGRGKAASQQRNVEEFIQLALDVHGNKYDYSKTVYVNSQTKITIVCSKHGEFYQTPANHLQGQGCPSCQASKGELVIKTMLDKHNIVHVPQYRIPEVLNQLYYDFFLPDYNILIEFHGKQHFEYSPFFHRNGEDDFVAQKNRDVIVRYNAKHFKYTYLEFDHKQLEKLGMDDFKKFVLEEISKFRKRSSP